MSKTRKLVLIKAYEAMEIGLQQRIASTPVNQDKQLLHDFTQFYRTKGKLARLKGVSVNG
ncbi:hypothetical protein [Levilactobacillus brevis]|uniref:hypothetical protein n=1 Tax=Levilactobacillus brevis TaxID=1580 RepID=UPI00111BBDA9|nr:hypothetical protein [Levilactobacillus brevis]QCZ50962.1 hypothetical protein SAC12_1388 [Levilactobacillus brevis]QCZ50997.1 hypothetical protein SAC12_1424 [Levilactobacillus brevis]